jgi:hypothetical protein
LVEFLAAEGYVAAQVLQNYILSNDSEVSEDKLYSEHELMSMLNAVTPAMKAHDLLRLESRGQEYILLQTYVKLVLSKQKDKAVTVEEAYSSRTIFDLIPTEKSSEEVEAGVGTGDDLIIDEK